MKPCPEHSLIQTFDAAKRPLSNARKEAGFAPSQPQIFVGKEMPKNLPKLEEFISLT